MEPKFDSIKWQTVLVRNVKEKRAILIDTCVDHCILLLKHLSNHAFDNKRFQTLVKDQLDRTKAMCSFNIVYGLLDIIYQIAEN